MRRSPIIFIVGPTAIGKTALSVKLAKAIHGEIISCDSMQVYKGMAVLSQAPADAEKKNVRHHLIGVLSPENEYSAAAFVRKASRLIKGIIERNKIPIVAGGSGLYVKALIDGLFPSPKADVKFRKRMQRYASRHGSVSLHQRLEKIDPETADRVHPNDARRIIRALEIHHSTGHTMTELKSKTKGLSGRYNIKIAGLVRPRREVYSNIESRIDAMFASGIVDEVKKLRDKKLSKTARAVLGYKEILGYLDGGYGLDAAKALMKLNTRRFAKRQMTWFGSDRRVRWYDMSKMTDAEIIRNIIRAG